MFTAVVTRVLQPPALVLVNQLNKVRRLLGALNEPVPQQLLCSRPLNTPTHMYTLNNSHTQAGSTLNHFAGWSALSHKIQATNVIKPIINSNSYEIVTNGKQSRNKESQFH